MKLKPVPEKMKIPQLLDETQYSSGTIERGFALVANNILFILGKLNEIIDYQEYLRKEVQDLKDKGR